MGLPSIPLPTSSVVIGGEAVTLRSLSRKEVLQITKYEKDQDKAEAFILACGTDTQLEEAIKWREQTGVQEVETLLQAIAVLSGLPVDPKASALKKSTKEPSSIGK